MVNTNRKYTPEDLRNVLMQQYDSGDPGTEALEAAAVLRSMISKLRREVEALEKKGYVAVGKRCYVESPTFEGFGTIIEDTVTIRSDYGGKVFTVEQGDISEASRSRPEPFLSS